MLRRYRKLCALDSDVSGAIKQLEAIKRDIKRLDEEVSNEIIFMPSHISSIFRIDYLNLSDGNFAFLRLHKAPEMAFVLELMSPDRVWRLAFNRKQKSTQPVHYHGVMCLCCVDKNQKFFHECRAHGVTDMYGEKGHGITSELPGLKYHSPQDFVEDLQVKYGRTLADQVKKYLNIYLNRGQLIGWKKIDFTSRYE